MWCPCKYSGSKVKVTKVKTNFVQIWTFPDDNSNSWNPKLDLKWCTTLQEVFCCFYPRPVLAFGYCRCLRVCVCVRVSVSHEFIRAITHQPFKLGSPNLDQRCKRPSLRALLFCGMIDRDLQGQIELQKSKFTPFWACACHNTPPIEVTISKFGTKCISALFRSLPISGLIEIDLQFNFLFQTRPNWAFYAQHWHSSVRLASL